MLGPGTRAPLGYSAIWHLVAEDWSCLDDCEDDALEEVGARASGQAAKAGGWGP